MRAKIRICILSTVISLLFACSCGNKNTTIQENSIGFNFSLSGTTIKSSGLEYIGIPLIDQKDKVLDWNKDSILIKVICNEFHVDEYNLKVNNQPSKLLVHQEYIIDLSNQDSLIKIELCKAETCLSKYINIDRNLDLIDVVDSDGDGLADNIDNCIYTSNYDQLDSDRDGQGDVCDNDDDNDGVRDKNDKCPKSGVLGKVDSEGCPISIVVKPELVIEKDTDGDGFVDSKDRCPNDFSITNSGCPNLDKDTDGDGILDKYDSCPQSGRRGEVDNKGCPRVEDKDTDKDGFSDALDKCPYEFSRTNNGCPHIDKDTDGDGLLDKVDKCPKEGKKGEVDKRGCPYLKQRGSIIKANSTCFSGSEKSNKIALKFSVKQRVSLSSVELHTLTMWSNVTISLKKENGLIVGNRIKNERIIPGSDISLLEFGIKLEPGIYELVIDGYGEALNISKCITGPLQNSEISILSNTYFFNLLYRY